MTTRTAQRPKVSLKSIAPQLRQVLEVLRGLDERAAGLGENEWLHTAIGVMRSGGRERDRRLELDEAAEKRERGFVELEKDYAGIVGRSVNVDRERIVRIASYVSNLLRECGEKNL